MKEVSAQYQRQHHFQLHSAQPNSSISSRDAGWFCPEEDGFDVEEQVEMDQDGSDTQERQIIQHQRMNSRFDVLKTLMRRVLQGDNNLFERS